MAISRYGMPRSGMTPIPSPMTSPGQSTPTPGRGAQMPQAMPPAGLPPDAYATMKSPLKKPKKAGPLAGLSQPRRITPSDTNQSQMMGNLSQTQVGQQLTPDAVMGMDNKKWTDLLAQFGVFA